MTKLENGVEDELAMPQGVEGGNGGRPRGRLSLLYGHNALSEGVADEFCVTSEIELAHQIRPVGLDRPCTDEELVCNPSVTHALTDQIKDFPLTCREGVIWIQDYATRTLPVRLDNLFGERGTQIAPASHDFTHCQDQFIGT